VATMLLILQITRKGLARYRLDRRHGPVCHSVRLALSGIGTMTKVTQTEVKTTEPPVSISRLISNLCKGGPAAPAFGGYHAMP
jgi:hypothetical protein